MATITEDYCSQEVYRLLREKGFDGEIHTTYDKNGYTQASITLQMAIKWLREVHNLSVEVYRTACGYIGCIVAVPSGTDIKFLEEDGDDLPSGQYTSWEKACEAAIKYCLENLI